ncbi:MAG: DUF350 domain-containing protein [Clostridium sp.]
MQDILNTVIYSCLGIVLMMIGTYLVDLVIPCHFPTEIKKGNVAVGYLTAGISIAVGIILKSAIISPSAISTGNTMLQEVGGTIIYFIIGIVFCILGYVVIDKVNKEYDLSKEIGAGNAAAGIMVMGLFIGLATVISGVIV